MKIASIMQQALNSNYGIALKFETCGKAKFYRRRFYNCRDRLRAQGNNDFDALSFVLYSTTFELMIIKRSSLSPRSGNCSVDKVRPLQHHELPDHIVARGKFRGGLDAEWIRDIIGRYREPR